MQCHGVGKLYLLPPHSMIQLVVTLVIMQCSAHWLCKADTLCRRRQPRQTGLKEPDTFRNFVLN